MRTDSNCRIGIMNPTYGGKPKAIRKRKTLRNKTRKQKGKGCGCGGEPQPKAPFMALPSEASMGPLTAALYKGGFNCPCALAPQIHTPMGGGYSVARSGGYRATKRNLKYLKLWKQGKSIGFTMRSSLKAKGLIPRANGTKRVSPKYR